MFRFLYTGEKCDGNPEVLFHLAHLAEAPGLLDTCKTEMIKTLNIDNVCKRLQLAFVFAEQYPDFLTALTEFVAFRLTEVFHAENINEVKENQALMRYIKKKMIMDPEFQLFISPKL